MNTLEAFYILQSFYVSSFQCYRSYPDGLGYPVYEAKSNIIKIYHGLNFKFNKTRFTMSSIVLSCDD